MPYGTSEHRMEDHQMNALAGFAVLALAGSNHRLLTNNYGACAAERHDHLGPYRDNDAAALADTQRRGLVRSFGGVPREGRMT